MQSADSDAEQLLPPTLHIPTPLLYSTCMSKQAGCNVWLKLENMQPTQSFKLRGVGTICTDALLERDAQRLVTAGDTNAALAVAYSARQLGVPATVFIPRGSQASAVRAKIELEGADIVEEGRSLREAYNAARAFVRECDGAVMIDTADDAAAIAGNATIVAEISIQLQRRKPAVIIAPVGSGGLLAGLITGLQQCLWQRVPVIAVETHNTNSFQRALLLDCDQPEDKATRKNTHVKASKSKMAMSSEIPSTPPPSLLPPLEDDVDESGIESKIGSLDIKPPRRSDSDSTIRHQSKARASNDCRTAEPTVATCLLAGSVCPKALELSREHPVVPISVSEAMAVEACRRFLDDHHMLIEVGSAAALSIVAKGLTSHVIPDLDSNSDVVVLVTGGANINFDRLDSYRQRFPYPAPIIAKSGQDVFMRMLDPAQLTTADTVLPSTNTLGILSSQSRALGSSASAVSTLL
ncbi:catabolic L-serine/threonine dehydratase [Kickxella alabastrina]|uniref:Catabolic L-serine/threonine dehydratase n=1 Tax=Kickxella alabastrina TaxID=61397 RepID=A0ACC1IQZ5_9FUNG|nr:catabolic L-serine/threonine dehydratase [Kickxella alabastrina]